MFSSCLVWTVQAWYYLTVNCLYSTLFVLGHIIKSQMLSPIVLFVICIRDSKLQLVCRQPIFAFWVRGFCILKARENAEAVLNPKAYGTLFTGKSLPTSVINSGPLSPFTLRKWACFSFLLVVVRRDSKSSVLFGVSHLLISTIIVNSLKNVTTSSIYQALLWQAHL